jgi:hypothetical protein
MVFSCRLGLYMRVELSWRILWALKLAEMGGEGAILELSWLYRQCILMLSDASCCLQLRKSCGKDGMKGNELGRMSQLYGVFLSAGLAHAG